MHRSLTRALALGLLIGAALASPAPAAEDWTLKDDRTAPGDLAGFDFAEKRVIFRDGDGDLHPVPVEDLTSESRWRLLVSPVYARSFPDDDWTAEQMRYLLFAVSGPAVCLFVSFYLCALVLMKSGSLWQALAGWLGSILLGGFLAAIYAFLSEKAPASATGIFIVGGIVILAVLSVFVSIVYRTATWQGAKLIILHFFGALFFLLLVVLAARKATQIFDLERFIEEKIMIPVGLLPKE